jgi:hypothetical protein
MKRKSEIKEIKSKREMNKQRKQKRYIYEQIKKMRKKEKTGK